MTIDKEKNQLKAPWRLWLVKKLLSNQLKKEEIFDFLNQIFDEKEENINNTEVSSDIDNDENDLINNILKLQNKTVEDIMVPRDEIIAISTKQSLKEILDTINNETHSRMPIFKDNLDDILGMIHIKDILTKMHNDKFEINKIIRNILYVAPASPVLDLLGRMRKSKIHLALVVDEHGGVDGLVTIEDLVEEIVGEIEDEHDAEDYTINLQRINSKNYIVDSFFTLEELEKLFNITFTDKEKKEIDTIGGLIFHIAGKIPSVGEEFYHKKGIKMKIIDASERRINKIKLTYNL